MGVVTRRQRRSARAAVAALILQIPHFLRLLFGLMRDGRVSSLDKALVIGAIVYVLTPIDMLPDFLGFLGMVDDLYLLALVFDRLIVRAGPELVHEHWGGDREALRFLVEGLEEIGSFVPTPVRRLIRGRVKAA